METLPKFRDTARETAAREAYAELVAKYGIPKQGRHRAAFVLKNHVLKFPLCEFGELDNHWEATRWDENVARGREITYHGFVCNVQEKVTPVTSDFQSLPNWTRHIDCQQVGYTKSGKLKAYDYGRY